jgi:hypothetical protein
MAATKTTTIQTLQRLGLKKLFLYRKHTNKNKKKGIQIFYEIRKSEICTCPKFILIVNMITSVTTLH